MRVVAFVGVSLAIMDRDIIGLEIDCSIVAGRELIPKDGTGFLKLGKGDEAKSKCSKVLDLDASNIKARFRRGCAYLLMNDPDNAEADLNKAAEQDPDDAAIKKELAKVVALRKKNEAKEKGFAKKMFG